MNPVIIALSGKKGAGKNEIASTVLSLLKTHFCQDYDSPCCESVLECSFADDIKTFCINTLGLTKEQCYGSDEEKNLSTEYMWENVPDFLRWRFAGMQFVYGDGSKLTCTSVDYESSRFFYWRNILHNNESHAPVLAEGPMSGRQIMQIFGTDLIRSSFGNVWATATIRRIKRDRHVAAIITDNRFPNEIETVLQEPNGFIIRLSRAPYSDEHPSEKALDNFIWERDRCYMLDNAEMTIEQQIEAVKPLVSNILERSV